MARKKHISYEILKEVARKINFENKTLKELSVELDIHPDTLGKKLKKCNIEYNPKNKEINLSDEEISFITNEYNSGKTLKEVAGIYNLTYTGLNSFLKKKGIDLSKSERYKKHKYFSLNNKIFEEIDTEEKAYWLGFILADGYINKTYDKLEIALQEKDLNHLEKFKKFINTSVDIKYKEKEKSYRITICSKDICRDLKKHGIENAKSLTCRLNSKLLNNEKLKYHYIRGFWDGDGSIYFTKAYKATVSFVGNKFIINDIKENIDLFKDSAISHKKNTNAYIIKISHKKSIEFVKRIYQENNIYLERKYNKVIAVCDEKYPSISQIIRTE